MPVLGFKAHPNPGGHGPHVSHGMMQPQPPHDRHRVQMPPLEHVP